MKKITFVIKYIKKYGACLRAELHPSISSHPCTHPRTYLNIIKLCTDYIRTCSKTWGPCNIYVVIHSHNNYANSVMQLNHSMLIDRYNFVTPIM